MATRNYAKEYANYGGKPEQIANRAERNAARAALMKKGLVKKGDFVIVTTGVNEGLEESTNLLKIIQV